jgi:hypothetical protein
MLRSRLRKVSPDAVIQEKMPEFRDGAVVVNRYIPLNPPMLGASLKNPGLELTKETLQTVERFCEEEGAADGAGGREHLSGI